MQTWQEMLPLWVAKSRRGLITDVDGTISPIVDHPQAAQVTPASKQALVQLVDQLELVAVVSGRAAPDVQARVGVPGVVYVGNHGMERWRDGEVEIPEAVRKFRPAMQSVFDVLSAGAFEGVIVEDKDATLSVHYRQAANPDEALLRLRPMIHDASEPYGLRVYEGRMLFEIRPPIDMDKGSALHTLINEYELDAAIYIGDDTTDVDALRVAKQQREQGQCYAFGIGVRAAETPQSVLDTADFVLDGVEGVELFLSTLLMAASASSS
jgi:trehalose 6-phosphate phosphatase